MTSYYDKPYDNGIDQDLCRMYEGFYYYRVYDLEADRNLDEWHLWENCKVADMDGMTVIIKKELIE
jgi:hypothetical protein